jgi:hypothetical protein
MNAPHLKSTQVELVEPHRVGHAKAVALVEHHTHASSGWVAPDGRNRDWEA